MGELDADLPPPDDPDTPVDEVDEPVADESEAADVVTQGTSAAPDLANTEATDAET